MRILLTGRTGQVGWELERRLAPHHEVLPTDRATLDLADADSIRRVVREAKPDVIVNAAAYTAVDKAEQEPEAAMLVNALGPEVLAEEARRVDALLVHYSTDYVYDGRKGAPYVEDDHPNPLSVYGWSKLEGERRVLASRCHALVLRTSWVYGPRSRNFLGTVIRKGLDGETVRVVDNEVSIPTSCAFVARHTVRALERPGAGARMYHLVPSGEASRYDFVVEAFRTLRLSGRVERMNSSDYQAAAQRPSYSVLSNAKFSSDFGVLLEDWRSLVGPTAVKFRISP